MCTGWIDGYAYNFLLTGHFRIYLRQRRLRRYFLVMRVCLCVSAGFLQKIISRSHWSNQNSMGHVHLVSAEVCCVRVQSIVIVFLCLRSLSCNGDIMFLPCPSRLCSPLSSRVKHISQISLHTFLSLRKNTERIFDEIHGRWSLSLID